MLERIVNIAPGSDYQKSSAKSSHYTRSAHFLHSLNSTMNDSISLSPATAYLSSIHWKLKKLNNEKEKIILSFEFDDLNFTATMETSGMSRTIDYEISKTINKVPFVYQAMVGLESNISKKQSEKFEVVTNLPVVHSLLDELTGLNDYMVNISTDNAQAKDIFFKKEKELSLEFEYIDGCVISFLEKFLSMNLMMSDKRDGLNHNLLIKRIQISRL